jgi:hypothetical protein
MNQFWVCMDDRRSTGFLVNVVYRSANHDDGCSRTGIISLPAPRNPMRMPYGPPIVRFLIFSHNGFYRAVSVRHTDFSGGPWEIGFNLGLPSLVTAACGGLSAITSSPFRSDHAIWSIGIHAVSIFCRSPGCAAPIAKCRPSSPQWKRPSLKRGLYVGSRKSRVTDISLLNTWPSRVRPSLRRSNLSMHVWLRCSMLSISLGARPLFPFPFRRGEWGRRSDPGGFEKRVNRER